MLGIDRIASLLDRALQLRHPGRIDRGGIAQRLLDGGQLAGGIGDVDLPLAGAGAALPPPVTTSRVGTTALARPAVTFVVKSLILLDTGKLLGHLTHFNGSAAKTFRV